MNWRYTLTLISLSLAILKRSRILKHARVSLLHTHSLVNVLADTGERTCSQGRGIALFLPFQVFGGGTFKEAATLDEISKFFMETVKNDDRCARELFMLRLNLFNEQAMNSCLFCVFYTL